MPSTLNNLASMPKMRAAFSGWKSNVTLVFVSNAIDANGFNIPVKTSKLFKGTVQPLSPEKIRIKPESQRSNQFLQMHFEVGFNNELNIGDEFEYLNKPYRVEAKLDYTLNNYIEYHAVELLA